MNPSTIEVEASSFDPSSAETKKSGSTDESDPALRSGSEITEGEPEISEKNYRCKKMSSLEMMWSLKADDLEEGDHIVPLSGIMILTNLKKKTQLEKSHPAMWEEDIQARVDFASYKLKKADDVLEGSDLISGTGYTTDPWVALPKFLDLAKKASVTLENPKRMNKVSHCTGQRQCHNDC